MATIGLGSPPLVVITGPTASGKTALAIDLAKRFGGEIICADSRTVYRGMDIGTAKPTPSERAQVPHWGLDLVAPNERFTAADFKDYTDQKIKDIRDRGRIPFLVGGTGLYIDAVLFDFKFGADIDPRLREELESLSIEELQIRCLENNIDLPENHKNKRHLIRAIERINTSVMRRDRPIENSLVVGITTDRDILRTRIELRAEQMFYEDVAKEATVLADKYGWENEAMTGNIYQIIRQYLQGEIESSGMVEKIAVSDWRLAKRQLTWLRRNPYVLWGDLGATEQYLTSQLASLDQM